MKKTSGSRKLPLMGLGLGAAAWGLRRMLYLTAVDAKNLLVANHPLEIALAALTAAALTLIILTVRKKDGSNRYEDNYTADAPAALGHTVMALGILGTVLTREPLIAGYLGSAWQWLGLAAPVCLVAAGIARMGGRKPFRVLYVVPSLFFMFDLVIHYQLWSGNPQMQDYIFTLLSGSALLLFSYYTAAFSFDIGRRRMVLGMGTAAIYLCMAELAWSEEPLLYAAGLIWVLTGMCAEQAVPAPEKE